MVNAELKTKLNHKNVEEFLNGIANERKRRDCFAILKMMKAITRAEPKMWGNSIVGFGKFHYKYESGREGDWFLTGFSPRKQNLTLYIMAGFKRYPEFLKKLGKHRTGSSCLYINKFSDINHVVLKKLLRSSVRYFSEKSTR